MIKKILDITIDVFIIIGLIIVLSDIVVDTYKNIKITNKIEQPALCIEINDEYYCKVQDNQKKMKIIEA